MSKENSSKLESFPKPPIKQAETPPALAAISNPVVALNSMNSLHYQAACRKLREEMAKAQQERGTGTIVAEFRFTDGTSTGDVYVTPRIGCKLR